jgi:diguanylate cyclase (GGDEF)-like protein
MPSKLAVFLVSADPKLRRQLGYWAGSGLLYLLLILLLQLQVLAGTASAGNAALLSWYGVAGVLFFYVLVRASTSLGISPWVLAMLQGLFALSCTIGNYLVSGPLRGAALMIMLVVMVFTTFSLRPRATMALFAIVVAALGATMALMVAHDPLRYPLHIEAMHFALATTSLLAIALLTGQLSKLRAGLKRQKTELLAAMGKIRTLATVDELTSLANRRYMNEVLSAEERRQAAPGQVMCIALLDLDFFKQINDGFGHDAGDSVLRTFASVARAELRSADLLARWGGEEFLLMLPETDVTVAQVVLKRMADRVRAIRIPELALGRELTFSVGLVQRTDDEPFAETITRADRAMYTAKTSGRDMVVAG